MVQLYMVDFFLGDRFRHDIHDSWKPCRFNPFDTELREYPLEFGRAVTSLYDEFVTTARGMGSPPSPSPPAIESFCKMDNCGKPGLEYARLTEVFNYLRRGKYLDIPESWKPYISKPF